MRAPRRDQTNTHFCLCTVATILSHRIARLPTARLPDWICACALACIVGMIQMDVCLVLLCLRREECVQNPMPFLPTIEYRCPSHRHCFRCCRVRRSPHGPHSRTAPLVAMLVDDVKLIKLKPRTTSRTPTTHACIVLVATSVSPTRHWRWRELGERGGGGREFVSPC